MSRVVLHVGYHKTGTSWLQSRWFTRDDLGWAALDHLAWPIHAPHPLEFDAGACRRHYQPLVERALAAGRVPVLSAERLSGNPHSGGYDSKEIAGRLAEVFDDPCVVVVVREQRSMLMSTYRQYVRVGGGCSLRDYAFGEADGRRPMFRLGHFCYDRLVSHYQQLFGRDAVVVMTYEGFRDDPADFTRRLAEATGTRADEATDFGDYVNASVRPVALALRRRVNPFVKRDSVNGYSALASPTLARVLRPLVKAADALAPDAWQRRVRESWRAQIAEGVGDHFAESNRRLAELTGLDLAALGYDVAPSRSPAR